jgi:large subunit ribosomal protein L18
MDASNKRAGRDRRRARIAKKVRGTARRPRLSVYRSNSQIYAQVIDDDRGHTLAAASSLEEGVDRDGAGKVGAARQVGELIAQRAEDAGVTSVVFDRGGFRYAGRLKALAEGARERGLEF